MPLWMVAALNAIRGAFPGAVRLAPRALTAAGTVGGLSELGELLPNGGDGKRRRRRRALTQSDRNDIAFVAATLGQPAAKQFALILASRMR